MSRLRTIIGGLGFAEAPRWHDGNLWFVDFFSGAVHRADLAGNHHKLASVEHMPGGLGFLPDGTPLVVSQRDFRILRIGPDGALATHAKLGAHCRGAANDLLVDRAGRCYVGHHGFDFFGGAEPQASSLILVATDGSVREAAKGLVFPNGMALSPDGKTLIVAESFANRLSAFDVAEDGTLGNHRIWAELPGHTPDGICLDAEGAVWAASPLSGRFVRVREGGEVLDEIETEDDRWAVACTFVGDGRDTFCGVTAATTLDDMPRGRSEAFIQLAEVTIPGAGFP